MARRESLKKMISTGVAVIFGVGLTSCSTISSTQEVPVLDNKTPMTAPLPDIATATEELPTATSTEVPATLTATEVPPTATPTEVPPTETPAITATPDLANYAKFTPEAATINEANWNGVNWKFAGVEKSTFLKNLRPGDQKYKGHTFEDGKERAMIYFIGDGGILLSKVNTYNSYVKVTFSDGKNDYVREGVVGDGKGINAIAVSQDSTNLGWGQIDIAVMPPTDGLEVVKVEIANSRSQKDKTVTLYEK